MKYCFYLILFLSFLEISLSILAPAHLKKYQFKRYNNYESQPDEILATYDELYYDQIIDHYDYLNNDTYQMRYLVNSTWWDPENYGPILFYCGNEGPIDGFWNNSGFLYNGLAQDLNGLVLFAEHRYFGKSMPFGNLSFEPENVKYLTVQQAMSDYGQFLHDFKSNHCPKCPVIAFGGSYGGMLAVWMRIKFSNIIDGAVASSAPFLMFYPIVNPYGYMEIVTNDFKNTPVTDCAELIHLGFNYLDEYANEESEYEMINEEFMLCEDSLITNSDGVYVLQDWLTEGISTLAMVDYPYQTDLVGNIPGNPVLEACLNFEDLNMNSPPAEIFSAMLDASLVYYDYEHESECYTIYEEEEEDEAEGWYYLECSDMVLPIGQNGVTDMFPVRPWNFELYSEECLETYGFEPREDWALTYFGGRDLYDLASLTNVFFANGKLDPWSAGGLKFTLTDDLPAFFMEESAHHLDLRAPNPLDPPAVTYGRDLEKYYITEWVNQKIKIESVPEYSREIQNEITFHINQI